MRLLIVEDDRALRESIASQMKREGFACDLAADGREGEHLGLEIDYDAAIIDLGLPILDGMSLISVLRKQGRRYPILVLTARSAWQDKVEGLESGADDYLTKPFQPEELLARINALLRRSLGVTSTLSRYGPIEIDTSAKSVTLNGNPVELTGFEYNTLVYLSFNKTKTISKAELTEHLYDQDFDRDSNVIEVFIGRLRKKLDPTGELNVIVTQRGLGYKFNLTEEQ